MIYMPASKNKKDRKSRYGLSSLSALQRKLPVCSSLRIRTEVWAVSRCLREEAVQWVSNRIITIACSEWSRSILTFISACLSLRLMKNASCVCGLLLAQPIPVSTGTSTATVPVWRTSGAATKTCPPGVPPPASAPTTRLSECLCLYVGSVLQ